VIPPNQRYSEIERTSVEDEYFTNDHEVWLVKSERTPTRNAARLAVAKIGGEDYMDLGCRTRRARIEWLPEEGWWLTIDPAGPFEVWEVYAR